MRKLSVFLSYSHKDEELCKELLKHLQPLRKLEVIGAWYDRMILPGQDWDQAILGQLELADVIIFLVSVDFINSDYVQEREIPIAMKRHKNGEAIIVPIMLRKCDVEHMPFAQLQALPRDMVPVTSKNWYTSDDALANVAEGLKQIFKTEIDKLRIEADEEAIWKSARMEDTSAAYVRYLRTSKLKSHLEAALSRIVEPLPTGPTTDPSIALLEMELLNQERKEVAMELHDNVGSTIAIVRMWMNQVNGNEEVVNNICRTLDELQNSVRRLSHSMRQGILSANYSLRQAILDLQRDSIQDSRTFNVSFDGVEQMQNPPLEMNLFRILQVLVANVNRHSKATSVNVSIAVSEGKVRMEIEDNGVGMDLNKPVSGLGLAHVKTRVERFNGQLQIDSNEGHGTKVSIVIPFAAHQPRN